VADAVRPESEQSDQPASDSTDDDDGRADAKKD